MPRRREGTSSAMEGELDISDVQCLGGSAACPPDATTHFLSQPRRITRSFRKALAIWVEIRTLTSRKPAFLHR